MNERQNEQCLREQRGRERERGKEEWLNEGRKGGEA